MGNFLHRTKNYSEEVQCVWGCSDLIHEIMNYLPLKDIASISRIHRASSHAIFTYRFKNYHPCEYRVFVEQLSKYLLLSVTGSRKNMYAKLKSLQFNSIGIDRCLNSAIYNYPSIFTCSSLQVVDIEMLYRIWTSWKEVSLGIVAAVKKLTIQNPEPIWSIFDHGGFSSLAVVTECFRGIESSFDNLREIYAPKVPGNQLKPLIARMSLTSLTVYSLGHLSETLYLPQSLEYLFIEQIHNCINLDFSHLVNLKKLQIVESDSITINPIILPDSLECLQLPIVILIGQRMFPGHLNSFTCKHSGHPHLSTFVGLAIFKNTNIRILNLLNFSPAWWNRFTPPATLERLRCDYSNIQIVIGRVRSLPDCPLNRVVIGIISNARTFASSYDFALTICDDKHTTKIYDKYGGNVQLFHLTFEEFESNKMYKKEKISINRLAKFQITPN